LGESSIGRGHKEGKNQEEAGAGWQIKVKRFSRSREGTCEVGGSGSLAKGGEVGSPTRLDNSERRCWEKRGG